MKYSDEQILKAVAECNTWAGVYRLLVGADAKPSPGMQTHLKRRALRAGADVSHFRYLRKVKTEPTVVTAEQVE